MFKKFASIILGSSACLLFALPGQAQSFLQYANTYWLVKNSQQAARGEQIEDRTTSINWALQQNEDTVKRETRRLLRESREAMMDARLNEACLAYAYLKTARLNLLENRIEPLNPHINDCYNLGLRSFMDIVENEYQQVYRKLD
ncbi:MAG: hypothetical protein SAL07_21000 [Oscillatoria sp. PMC 1051.18]|nr:hypothetical protein [Oscillatoria sp. PMC 1050.18]MEC5032383.1 hypothetical protein [Oscillatoria sp. PMC 1051.18]